MFIVTVDAKGLLRTSKSGGYIYKSFRFTRREDLVKNISDTLAYGTSMLTFRAQIRFSATRVEPHRTI